MKNLGKCLVLEDSACHCKRHLMLVFHLTEYLVLSDNDFSGTFPTQLAELTKLEILLVDGNDIFGTIPSALCENVPLGGIIVDCHNVSCGCCVCSEKLP
jgi:hypothetical protein